MQSHDNSRASLVAPALLGAVAGSAIQLQQAQLWDVAAYLVLAAAGLAAVGASRWLRRSPKSVCVLVGIAIAFFALCGLRSAQFASQALNPALEGRGVSVTG
ncbi:MAG: competence protein ComEC, partial [Ramlibacter sp.]|nr:competence protein ComEC [Ramlibacter sp.]